MIILNHLARKNLTMEESQQKIPKYYMLKEKIKLNNKITSPMITKKIKENFNQLEFDETDGIKVLGEDFWIHIRQSNTEPIIRIYIESKKEKQLLKLFNKIKKIFK